LTENDRTRAARIRSGRAPTDPDARVTKMKDGRTYLAYKAEHAMDLETGAMVSVVIHPADQGDTTSMWGTLAEGCENLDRIGESPDTMEESVADKGYHSAQVLMDLQEAGIRSYIAEPDRGRRKWTGKTSAQKAVYANRNRMKREKAKALHRKRGEILERSFAHLLDSGGMRRVWLRRRKNVWKRYLIHACAFNLSLVMRKLYQAGTPRGLEALLGFFMAYIRALLCLLQPIPLFSPVGVPVPANFRQNP
jgi:transposase